MKGVVEVSVELVLSVRQHGRLVWEVFWEAETLFQVQQRFWPLNFFRSQRNEEPEHSLL